MMKKYEKIPCPHCGKLVAYDNTFGKKYHFDNCKSKPIEGFGDVVKKITNFLGIETCDACEERRKKLNDLFPYTKSKKLNNEQIEFIKRIRSIREISSEDKVYLFATYNSIFGTHIAVCNCSGLIWDMREKLLNIYIANHSKNINE